LRSDLQRQVHLRLLVDLEAQASLHELTEALRLHGDGVVAGRKLADHIVAVFFADCAVRDVRRDVIGDHLRAGNNGAGGVLDCAG
jgi:hypothetical protein